MAIAELGWQPAVRSNQALAEGVNVASGRVVYKPVAEAHGLEYTPLASLID
jgi:alanine dehydrogenase